MLAMAGALCALALLALPPPAAHAGQAEKDAPEGATLAPSAVQADADAEARAAIEGQEAKADASPDAAERAATIDAPLSDEFEMAPAAEPDAEAAPAAPEFHPWVPAHSAREPRIRSEYALVVDQDTDEVLMQKNSGEISSIASITKLMTAMVTLDAGLALDEELQVSQAERTSTGWLGSALRPGVRLTRGEAMHLALMASENHAAQLLGDTYPGGIDALVAAMNAKARELGMKDSNFADPTGLNPQNRASPADLVRMVKAAYEYPDIRAYSVSAEYSLHMGKHNVRYRNTNNLTLRSDWQIGLQKTGYIGAAGRCLVMQAVIEGRRVVMVLLDSIGRYSRFADAQRIRDWLVAASGGGGPRARNPRL